MVNKENVQKVIDSLKAEEFSFNMNTWFDSINGRGYVGDKPECGTVACVGGHAQAVMLRENIDCIYNLPAICEWLGTSREQSDILFFGYPMRTRRAHAIAVLENLIATGVVDWKITKKTSAKKVAA